MSSHSPHRLHPAHPPVAERHNEPIILFVTVCADHRRALLAYEDVHALLRNAWSEAETWRVGRYVIMPNHVHLFCAPREWPPRPVGQWVRFWKAAASRRWPRPHEQPVWQRDCWDTQLRRHDSYAAESEYVVQNPVRAGLASTPDEWPFRGELNVLPWH